MQKPCDKSVSTVNDQAIRENFASIDGTRLLQIAVNDNDTYHNQICLLRNVFRHDRLLTERPVRYEYVMYAICC